PPKRPLLRRVSRMRSIPPIAENREPRNECGLALIASMMLLALLAALFAAYYVLTHTELKMAKSSKDSQSGFNAAEAGLNLRAQQIREIFQDYARPEGTSPANVDACEGEEQGSGDYS